MANNKNMSDAIDIKGLITTYISKWYLFAISVILCVGAGFIFTRVHKQDMVCRAQILISDDDASPFKTTGGLGSFFATKAYVEDELFVISSHSLYRNVAKALRINVMHYVKEGFLKSNLAFPTYPVDVVAPGVADTLSTGLSFKIKINDEGLADIKVKGKVGTRTKVLAKEKKVRLPYVVKTIYGDFTVTPTEYYVKGEPLTTYVTFNGYEAAAESLTDDLFCDIASKKSNLILLEYETPYPAYGVAVLDEILLKYNQQAMNDQNLQSEKTAEFLENRIRMLADDINQGEIAVQKYKEEHGITDVGVEIKYQNEKKGAIEEALIQAETQVAMLRLTRDFFADSVSLTEFVPSFVENEGLQGGIDNYNNMVAGRLELLKVAKNDNLQLQNIESRMRLHRKSMRTAAQQVLTSAELQLNELKALRSETESSLGQVPLMEREFLNLKRELGIKQSLFTFLLRRQEENAMVIANAIPKGKIVDEGYVLSKPIGLSNKIILAIFFLLGLMLPPIYLYLRKLILNRAESRSEIERKISVPVLGEMCIDKSGRSLVVTEHDTSSATELFRLMRSNLQFLMGNSSDKVVLMTSTRSGEGKSFISINLAATLAMQHDKRVIIVGMDIRNPQLANYLDISPRWGLTQYLSSGNISIDDMITPVSGVRGLDVIVAGPIPPNPAELLMSQTVDRLFDELRKRYDYIVVDSAPVGMVSDTFTLNRIADATIYVTRINHTTLDDLRYLESIYEDKRLNNLSVVINGTHSLKGYGYGYSASQAEKKRK